MIPQIGYPNSAASLYLMVGLGLQFPKVLSHNAPLLQGMKEEMEHHLPHLSFPVTVPAFNNTREQDI